MFGMMPGNQVKAESKWRYSLNAILDSGIRKTNTDIGALASKEKRNGSSNGLELS